MREFWRENEPPGLRPGNVERRCAPHENKGRPAAAGGEPSPETLRRATSPEVHRDRRFVLIARFARNENSHDQLREREFALSLSFGRAARSAALAPHDGQLPKTAELCSDRLGCAFGAGKKIRRVCEDFFAEPERESLRELRR